MIREPGALWCCHADPPGIHPHLHPRTVRLQRASDPEIADRLFLHVSTVKSHVNAIFAMLGVRERRGAVALVQESG
ncbi:helix-turn-helix transcriptional regulator [Brachybacterium sp. MASK1Z-5]|uniref:Helix-turn-helix transcriptional regulator n=1 Tax=Brachybacterium halotolerans TaxID=2795215 RepID=A0ABS1BAF6_9MICO|nr:helix-turn-helix transcriptional regulator [Brachybacterium halotolerans]